MSETFDTTLSDKSPGAKGADKNADQAQQMFGDKQAFPDGGVTSPMTSANDPASVGTNVAGGTPVTQQPMGALASLRKRYAGGY